MLAVSVTAIIVATSFEDSAAVQTGMFLPDEKKGTTEFVNKSGQIDA